MNTPFTDAMPSVVSPRSDMARAEYLVQYHLGNARASHTSHPKQALIHLVFVQEMLKKLHNQYYHTTISLDREIFSEAARFETGSVLGSYTLQMQKLEQLLENNK